MEVKTKELLASYESLKTEYGNLEENQMNLFAELANVYNLDWRDGNAVNFESAIDSERLEADKFKSYVWDKMSIFDFIYNKYTSLGSVIKCNLNRKSVVISALNSSIIKIDSIISEFNKMDLNFPYSEFTALRNCKQSYVSMKNRLSDIRDYFDSLFTKIEGIESEIATKIRELELFKAKEFSFTLLGKEKLSNNAYLDENAFALDYKKVELYKEEEKKSNDKLYNLMKGISNSYTSTNNPLYFASLNDLKNVSNILYGKRNSYIEALDMIPPIYGISIKKSIENFEED